MVSVPLLFFATSSAQGSQTCFCIKWLAGNPVAKRSSKADACVAVPTANAATVMELLSMRITAASHDSVQGVSGFAVLLVKVAAG
jgi:hypothetical protein